VRDAARKIVKRLNITGSVNIQFVTKGTDVMCIECNVRASRSFPFVSKTMGVDYIEAATKASMGVPADDMNLPTLETRDRPSGYVGGKCPIFSFTRLRGSDAVLDVEMASTGEVACFGTTKEEAFLKALLSTNFKMPNKNIMLSVQESLQGGVTLCAYQMYATKATADILEKNHVPCQIVGYPTELGQISYVPNAVDLLRNDEIGHWTRH